MTEPTKPIEAVIIPTPVLPADTGTPAVVAPGGAPVADATGSPEDSFDPANLSDDGLREFLGLKPEKKDEPAKSAQEQLDEAGDKAAQGALDDALKAGDEKPEAGVQADGPPASPEKKDGEAAEPAKKSYVIYGDDGKPLESVPVKEIELKVAGKQKRVDLDGLVRMAQSGGYNEQLQQEVAAARDVLPQWQQRAQEMEQAAKQLYDEREAILGNPETYLAKVEEYAKARSPEGENARLRRENEALRSGTMQQHAVQQVTHAAETVILPKFTALAEKYPHVKTEELIGQLDTLIRPYRAHGGPIDPALLPHVLDIIDRVIEPTAQQLHDAREEVAKAKTDATAAADAATQSAKAAQADVAKKVNEKVTKAKNDLSRTIAPVGRVTNRPAAPKSKPKTANEGADRALEDALESVLGSSAA